jgi:hypothetical protein
MNTTQAFQDGLPTFVMNSGPQDWCFFDDFNDLNISTTSAAAKWTHLTTDAGNTARLSLTEGGGVLALAYSSPTDEDVIHLAANAGIITGTQLKSGTPIRFGCKFKATDPTAGCDIHIGLSIHDTSMAAGAPADWVGFRVLAAETTGDLNLVVSKDSVVQMVDPICLLSDATWVRAFFEFWPTVGNTDSGTLYYEVHHNGSVTKGSLTVSNTWPDDVVIFPLIQVQVEGTDEDVLNVDWIYAHAIRADYVDGTG